MRRENRLLCAMTVAVCLFLPLQAPAKMLSSGLPEQEACLFEAPIQTIVIDAGHGGKDDGTVGASGLKEKDVALRVALNLRDRLISEGFAVIMTREDDRYLTLQERADVVAAHRADFLVSIHANAAKNKLARGYETFYLSDPGNDVFDPERPEEDRDYHYEHFFEEQQEMGKVYLNLLDRASGERRFQSIALAENIHDAMKENLRSRDRGVKRSRFFVLKNTAIPAVLIELGFLSNPKEEILLRSPAYQEKLINGIAGGLVSYRKKRQSADKLAVQ